MIINHDVLIVGSGAAGLYAAYWASTRADVAVMSKLFPTRSHTGAAQGGIGALTGNEEDKPLWHWFDTVKGGDYLGDQDAQRILCYDAPQTIYELENIGGPSREHQKAKLLSDHLVVTPAILANELSRLLRSRPYRHVILHTLYENCVHLR